jgi:hypothetical protein
VAVKATGDEKTREDRGREEVNVIHAHDDRNVTT